MTLEHPPEFRFDLSHLLGSFRDIYLVNAVAAFLLAASAPVAIILTAGQNGGLSESEIAPTTQPAC